MKSKVWDTFLLVPDQLRSDKAPALDAEWLLARGVGPEATLVLALLRDEVTPLVHNLQQHLAWYMFLIHDYSSGVPNKSDDKHSYVHLRLVFKKPCVPVLPDKWQMTYARPEAADTNGVYPRLIGYQSECMLRIIEHLQDVTEELALIKQMRQILHYFSNMAQMKIA